MTASLALKYDRPAPRYTSYPTAVQFDGSVDSDAYGRWLSGLPAGTRLSVYLHVPFCAAMCWFCGCHTRVAKSYAPVARYVETLAREIALVTAALPAGVTVGHVHWGGGSPTMLSEHDLVGLMDAVRKRLAFADDAEIAVELDPRTADRALIDALRHAGVTRASLGVQDFDARVQEAVNRVQPFEVTALVVDGLRGAGIDAVNVDLMYGLPLQTEAGVAETARRALALAPRRIALFGYAHVPWMKPHQKRIAEDALPGAAERHAQALAAAEVLVGAGYRQIGLDHFARPDDRLAVAADEGRLHRNFQGYTDDASAALVGLGASAIGRLPQGYVQNAAAVPDWRAAIEAGRFATARGRALTDDDRLRADVIERLMCDLRVDLDAVAAAHGADPAGLRAALPRMAELAGDGLVELGGDRVSITERGRPFVRLAAAAFDAYLSGTDRHARAV